MVVVGGEPVECSALGGVWRLESFFGGVVVEAGDDAVGCLAESVEVGVVRESGAGVEAHGRVDRGAFGVVQECLSRSRGCWSVEVLECSLCRVRGVLVIAVVWFAEADVEPEVIVVFLKAFVARFAGRDSDEFVGWNLGEEAAWGDVISGEWSVLVAVRAGAGFGSS